MWVQLSAREIRLLCESGDTDKDRKIDFSEFVNDFVHFAFEAERDEAKHRRLTEAEVQGTAHTDTCSLATHLPIES
eukprot:COSAG03_NODE_4425_length_1555_cov_2.398491_1_plen_76_part_00